MDANLSRTSFHHNNGSERRQKGNFSLQHFSGRHESLHSLYPVHKFGPFERSRPVTEKWREKSRFEISAIDGDKSRRDSPDDGGRQTSEKSLKWMSPSVCLTVFSINRYRSCRRLLCAPHVGFCWWFLGKYFESKQLQVGTRWFGINWFGYTYMHWPSRWIDQ